MLESKSPLIVEIVRPYGFKAFYRKNELANMFGITPATMENVLKEHGIRPVKGASLYSFGVIEYFETCGFDAEFSNQMHYREMERTIKHQKKRIEELENAMKSISACTVL